TSAQPLPPLAGRTTMCTCDSPAHDLSMSATPQESDSHARDAYRPPPCRRASGRRVTLPATTLVRQLDTHRLISSRYLPRGDSVLTLIADDDRQLADLFDLDHATNERLTAEHDLLPDIGIHELVFGVPCF